MKTYVLGDVHGAYKALLQVLMKSNFDYENDTLISLGDICDGWSEVVECFEELFMRRSMFPLLEGDRLGMAQIIFEYLNLFLRELVVEHIQIGFGVCAE